TRAYLKNNYLYRMGAAVLGIYGNSKQEALYPAYYVDEAKQKLDGTNRYTLRFAPGQLPPVNAFWSLTMYDEPQSLLVANPINCKEYLTMKTTYKLNLLAVALVSAFALTNVRAAGLTPAETKSIAEEGFIYGLPIVMNYGVMYEYAVDRNSGQFKAPFNQINNEARVFTYKDTSVITPNSDTPYSFLWMDLRAEPMVLSVPAVEKGRY